MTIYDSNYRLGTSSYTDVRSTGNIPRSAEPGIDSDFPFLLVRFTTPLLSESHGNISALTRGESHTEVIDYPVSLDEGGARDVHYPRRLVTYRNCHRKFMKNPPKFRAAANAYTTLMRCCPPQMRWGQ